MQQQLQKINWRQLFFLIFHQLGIGPKKPIQIAGTSATGHTGHTCPICGVQIAIEELESHFSTELSRIAKSNMYNERQELRRTLSMELHAVQSTLQSRTSRWEVSVTASLCGCEFKVQFSHYRHFNAFESTVKGVWGENYVKESSRRRHMPTWRVNRVRFVMVVCSVRKRKLHSTLRTVWERWVTNLTILYFLLKYVKIKLFTLSSKIITTKPKCRQKKTRR